MWHSGASKPRIRKADGRGGWTSETELGTDGVLKVEVLDEGGSDYIRNKVLRAALDGERQLIATRSAAPVPSVDTTTCTQSQVDAMSMPPAWCAYR